MSATYTAKLACDHPGCSEAFTVTRDRSVFSDDLPKLAREAGWYAEELSYAKVLAACPSHKAEAVAAGETAYKWACAVTEDMNAARKAVAKAHRKPRVAPWLKAIVDARERETD